MPRKSNKQPTIIDVAREAGVGIMSVSRVLNHHPGLKDSTRQKVEEAMERIGYTPNDAARMLKGRRARTIGLIVPDLSDFYASCFHAIQAVAMEHEYQTLVAATGRNAQVEQRQMDAMRLHGIAGLLLVGSGAESASLKRLLQAGIPLVALDRPLAVETDSVLVENRQGAAEAVRHLISHGHTRIACVGFDSGSFTVRERMEGYRDAMRAAGLEPLVAGDVNSEEKMESLVADWRNNSQHPTALFSVKRITSVQLLRALHRNLMRVPEEMAVAGFDDFELAEVLGTPLTVVRQAPQRVAKTAAELLFRRIDAPPTVQEESFPTEQICLPVELVLRGSCGCNGR